jgi:hypothetical protein
MADVPGGASGLLCREYRGKDGTQPVVKVDPGVISLTFALLAHERQAAEELSQWKAPVQERCFWRLFVRILRTMDANRSQERSARTRSLGSESPIENCKQGSMFVSYEPDPKDQRGSNWLQFRKPVRAPSPRHRRRGVVLFYGGKSDWAAPWPAVNASA